MILIKEIVQPLFDLANVPNNNCEIFKTIDVGNTLAMH
jgi:hypothetical protein